MKRVLYIIIFISFSRLVLGQNKIDDLYQGYKNSRPKYKKEICYDVTDSTKIEITGSQEWKSNKYIWIYYYESFDLTTGRNTRFKNTTVRIYNHLKRNTSINKQYTDDILKGKTHTIRISDSTTKYNNKNEIVFTSKYNAKDNSWTGYRKSSDGKRPIKFVSIDDSTRHTEIEYENDTLLYKEINFRRGELEDSSFTFDRNNKIIYKTIQSFNKLGNVAYKEEFDFSEDIPVITRTSYLYKYDKNNNWTEVTSITNREPSISKTYLTPIKQRRVIRRKIYY